ncbi:26281_t:CDS:1, partial [Gigaspora margarita]
GLKGINAALVTVVAPKSLNEAIAAARRVETGNYYGQHNAEVVKQVRVGSEL